MILGTGTSRRRVSIRRLDKKKTNLFIKVYISILLWAKRRGNRSNVQLRGSYFSPEKYLKASYSLRGRFVRTDTYGRFDFVSITSTGRLRLTAMDFGRLGATLEYGMGRTTEIPVEDLKIYYIRCAFRKWLVFRFAQKITRIRLLNRVSPHVYGTRPNTTRTWRRPGFRLPDAGVVRYTTKRFAFDPAGLNELYKSRGLNGVIQPVNDRRSGPIYILIRIIFRRRYRPPIPPMTVINYARALAKPAGQGSDGTGGVSAGGTRRVFRPFRVHVKIIPPSPIAPGMIIPGPRRRMWYGTYTKQVNLRAGKTFLENLIAPRWWKEKKYYVSSVRIFTLQK